MLRLYHVLIIAILLVLTPLGLKFVLPQFLTSKEGKTNPVATPTPSITRQITPVNSNQTTGNVWKNILGDISAPNDWQVVPCEGNAPLLCVSSKGEILGTVEVGVYPVNNNSDFKQNLTAANLPFDSKVDYQSPNYKPQVIQALKAWVTNQDNTLAKDRQAKYGNKITFSAYPLQEVPVGKLRGIRYGFVGLKEEGGVKEQRISHVAFDGKALYVITTAYDPGSVTGKFEKLENLAIFQPHLDEIITDLRLPK